MSHMPIQYWLMKSEPDVFSISDLKKNKTEEWDGVRNYQARNFMKTMKKNDIVLFYHSNAKPSGLAGLATIHKEALPDSTQFNKKSKYYDAKSTKENPRWHCVHVKYKKTFKEVIDLKTLKEDPKLSNMLVCQKGSRLSVQPVEKKDFDYIIKMYC